MADDSPCSDEDEDDDEEADGAATDGMVRSWRGVVLPLRYGPFLARRRGLPLLLL
ncbi:MAG: hypothetical protein ACTII7_08485 [Galactobacter sp.]